MSDRSTLDWAAEPDSPVPPPTWGRRAPEAQVLPWVFAALVGFLLLGNLLLAPHLTAPALRTWSTIFVAICVQAVPFLVFAAPFIIMRNTLLGARLERRRFEFVMMATIIAGFWSLMSGTFFLMTLRAAGLLA